MLSKIKNKTKTLYFFVIFFLASVIHTVHSQCVRDFPSKNKRAASIDTVITALIFEIKQKLGSDDK